MAKNKNLILSDKVCPKCNKTFKGTVKDKKCERCKAIEAENAKKGVGIGAVAAVGVFTVIKSVIKIIRGR